jgi:ubiquitin-like modifier-activating enzyme ATG7
MTNQKAVKFIPFSSTVDSPFWVEYCHLKLEKIQLSEDAIPVNAFYSPLEARLQCQGGGSSLNTSTKTVIDDKVVSSGRLLGFNTLESFSKINKNQLLRDEFLKAFLGESSDEILSSLTSFLLLTFADLKEYKVIYWFAVPALMTKTPITAGKFELSSSNPPIANDVIQQAFHTFRRNESQGQVLPFFVFEKQDPYTLFPLSKDLMAKHAAEDLIFGFLDPSRFESTTSDELPAMGWPMRNMIAFLSIHLNLGGLNVQILSFRPKRLHRMQDECCITDMETSSSFLLEVSVPPRGDYLFDGHYKVVGWELNARGKPGPRSVNLRPLLDQNHLAIQAADLNLKLMKWRMIPNLNVDLLQSTKVLLIGAGTLGCSVARTLLGWGIRDFTILDYGTVSYSNPVRQNLFTLEDCHFNNGNGKPKAQAATEALQEIAADVKSRGIHLSIPMPGHSSESQESIQKSVETLDQLIQEADIVYLLTDTRESRWLPTLMAAAHNKMLINAALGLDSWLVMRHGGGIETAGRLGCYFCNDVVAPENSTKNRTLDQQCTVTRPGLAPIASSMAVELMVSLLHHSLKQGAPAPAPNRSSSFSPTVNSQDQEEKSSTLGVMPHQIRGSLVSYTMMTPTVPCFVHCTACSTPIIDAYHNDKVALVYQACKTLDGAFLEELSGLAKFRDDAAEKIANLDDTDWDVDEEEDF